jgi:hypothetical protein
MADRTLLQSLPSSMEQPSEAAIWGRVALMRPFSKALEQALAKRKRGQGLFIRVGRDGYKRYYPGDVGERIEIADYQWRYAALFSVLQGAAVLDGSNGKTAEAPRDPHASHNL